MDENKLAVIIYKTTNSPIDAIKAMLESLNMPPGFLPTANIVGGDNRWRAYNQAMRSNDAKYKIYIDDSVVILNKNILIDLIEIFKSDQNVGMIGCSGVDRRQSLYLDEALRHDTHRSEQNGAQR